MLGGFEQVVAAAPAQAAPRTCPTRGVGDCFTAAG